MITLLGEPKSTQHIYRYTCRGSFASMYMTKEGKAIKSDYQLQARSQWKNEPIKGDVEVVAILYFGTKRKADIDNFNKLWEDALSGIVYVDDVQIQRLTLEKRYNKENPRIELFIKEI